MYITNYESWLIGNQSARELRPKCSIAEQNINTDRHRVI